VNNGYDDDDDNDNNNNNNNNNNNSDNYQRRIANETLHYGSSTRRGRSRKFAGPQNIDIIYSKLTQKSYIIGESIHWRTE